MKIAFDLDGTLANIEHRLHFIKGEGKKDWTAFFKACVNDAPIYPLVKLCRQMFLGGCHIEIWSGRSDLVRSETEQWLFYNGITYEILRMRKEGDHRADDVVKQEWLDAIYVSDRPAVAFDDRKRVVDMWRRNGIICCQVAEGDF